MQVLHPTPNFFFFSGTEASVKKKNLQQLVLIPRGTLAWGRTYQCGEGVSWQELHDFGHHLQALAQVPLPLRLLLQTEGHGVSTALPWSLKLCVPLGREGQQGETPPTNCTLENCNLHTPLEFIFI